MGVKTHVEPFPFGTGQGTPSLRVVLDKTSRVNGQGFDPDLITQIRSKIIGGVSLIQLDVPDEWWGQVGWDDFLRQMISDPLIDDLQIHAIRPLKSKGWSSLPLEWVIDISETFNEEMPRSTLYRVLACLNLTPQPYEIVWTDPVDDNISPRILELISETLRPRGHSWLYVGKSKQRKLAFGHASKSSSPWGVRRTKG